MAQVQGLRLQRMFVSGARYRDMEGECAEWREKYQQQLNTAIYWKSKFVSLKRKYKVLEKKIKGLGREAQGQSKETERGEGKDQDTKDHLQPLLQTKLGSQEEASGNEKAGPSQPTREIPALPGPSSSQSQRPAAGPSEGLVQPCASASASVNLQQPRRRRPRRRPVNPEVVEQIPLPRFRETEARARRGKHGYVKAEDGTLTTSCICRRNFPTTVALEEHFVVKITGKYPCDYPGCGEEFFFAADATKHKMTEHKQRTQYPCGGCKAFFASPKMKKKHQKEEECYGRIIKPGFSYDSAHEDEGCHFDSDETAYGRGRDIFGFDYNYEELSYKKDLTGTKYMNKI